MADQIQHALLQLCDRRFVRFFPQALLLEIRVLTLWLYYLIPGGSPSRELGQNSYRPQILQSRWIGIYVTTPRYAIATDLRLSKKQFIPAVKNTPTCVASPG